MPAKLFLFYFLMILWLSVFVVVGHEYDGPVLKSKTPLKAQMDAVRGLIGRVLGSGYVAKFQLEMISDVNGLDVFEIETPNADSVTLRGNTGVSLSSALSWYLKYYCFCEVSWGVNGTGNQLNVPNPLPSVDSKVRIVSPVRYRYYMNVCTVSYSMAWWDWKRWEIEIDWMALQGINLPLSFTGQEYIWAQVFTQLGLNESSLIEQFGGPAFLAWARMGNLRGWGGPLNPEWRKGQADMQKLILARQRSFGMISVLPGFAGFVPKELKTLYPKANITRSADWGRFNDTYCCVYLLEPLDPLFIQIGKLFIQVQTSEFGTDHIYNADTFNEMRPGSNDPQFLHDTSKAVYQGLTAADPNAVWLMQGWLFQDQAFWKSPQIEAYLSGVSNQGMLILDLFSEANPIWSKTNSYFGKSFIWCMLHNFGGSRGLYGNLALIASQPIEAKNTPGSTMSGTGITMEAIEQNPVIYELMTEMGWHSTHFDIAQWVQQYAHRRYGKISLSASDAWRLLQTSVYSDSSESVCIMTLRPRTDFDIYVGSNTTQLVRAWRAFIQSQQELPSTGPWSYDAVDLSRQVLCNFFRDTYKLLISAYSRSQSGANTVYEFYALNGVLSELVVDLDVLLNSDINYLLGNWIESARAWSNNSAHKDLYEFNARNQITLWGPRGEINDYASKTWGGLVLDYHKPRWDLFLNFLFKAIVSHKPFDTKVYESELFNLEWKWNIDRQKYPTTPSGDLTAILQQLLQKYATPQTNYIKMPQTDAPLNDLIQTWTRDIAQLQILCNIDPNCQGFNTNGYLKSSVKNTIHTTLSDLYVKT